MVPADRPLLSFTGTSATDANKAALPKAFTRPDEHNCAADTTRIYLGELFVNGLDNPEVSWHWAPIVSGAQPAQPTLGQPEFSVAGTLRGVDDSGDDVLADHPFGLDVDADLEPDPGYAFISSTRALRRRCTPRSRRASSRGPRSDTRPPPTTAR